MRIGRSALWSSVLFVLMLPIRQVANAESGSGYYLLGGPTAAGGARAGMGASAGVFYSSCQDSPLCAGFAQMAGHTARKNSVTFAETLAGYHVGFVGGFTGFGIRTAEKDVLIGHFTYGIGLGSVIISVRRYNENSKHYTEAVLAAFWPMRLN